MARGQNIDLSKLLQKDVEGLIHAAENDPKVYVSAVVLRPKDEVLLVRRTDPPFPGMWHLPGGKLRGGMHPSSMMEEIGGSQLFARLLLETPGAPSDTGMYVDPDGSVGVPHLFELYYRATIDPFSTGPVAGIGISEWRFFGKPELLRLQMRRRPPRFSPVLMRVLERTLDWKIDASRFDPDDD